MAHFFNRFTVFCFAVILWLNLPVFAQSQKSDLEARKKEKLAKISEINKILGETSQARRVSVGQLSALLAEISTRQELISNTQKELALIDEDIKETSQVITALQNDLTALKKEYAKMIYEASKTSSSYNKLTFIFSAPSFNEFYRRIEYLKQYSHARKIQVEQIQKTQTYLENQNKRISEQKKEKTSVIKVYEKERGELNSLIAEKDDIVKQLVSKEKELRKEINAEKKALAELEDNLLAIIKSEIKKTSGSNNATTVALTPETEVISTSFAANRLKLIWPVETGFISKKFGLQKHPVYNIVEKNMGINIQTKQGEKVRTVFDGEVIQIFERPGFGYTVTVNHGEYFTVYNNLENINVKTGDKVKRKDILGEVLTNSQGVSEVLFCILKNSNFQDPEQWLYKK